MPSVAHAEVIDGKGMAAVIVDEVKVGVQGLPAAPTLAIVQVGANPASSTYVRLKMKAAQTCGIITRLVRVEEEAITLSELLGTVVALNSDESVDGILIQLPLPAFLGADAERILTEAVDTRKDVDGLRASNMGQLALNGHEPLFCACTPLGCLEMLKRTGVELRGKHAVVIGASNIVGVPMMLLLLKEGCTCTICHIDTVETHKHTSQADILISATGQAHLVQRHWVKKGAFVIDVGINFVPDATKKSGRRMVGDVVFDEVAEQASFITPVPGGVGPMTVAMLMRNTLDAAGLRHAQSPGQVPQPSTSARL
jgi:methylenetetrahydrofolate dehydrogenase (NADP+)/methenyltetrahydrofolate cyclohydrolase/formyltetrahydrofolate synthetase